MSLTREQDRVRQKRIRDNMSDDELEEYRRKARDRMARGRRAAGVPERRPAQSRPPGLTPSQKGRKAAAARWAAHTPVRVVRRYSAIPTEVRDAYRRSHANSIIRLKYPTWVDLERAWA